MAEAKNPEPQRETTPSDPAAREKIENDPAVERGERIATGKQIARGGKATGDVPGATETKTTQ